MTMTDSLDRLIERVGAGTIKALSIKQPYPHHIFHDGKDVENRDWPTKGRGWFLIHAGVSTSELDRKDAKDMALPRGGIVGAARIVDCVTSMDSLWFYGDYGFVLKDAVAIPMVPCKGQLGFFSVPPEIIAEVLRALQSIKTTETPDK